MSSLFDFRKYDTEFKGRPVSMELRPLKSREVAEFLPLFLTLAEKAKAHGKEVGRDIKFTLNNAEDIKIVIEAQAKAVEVLPNAVRNLTGIDDGWPTVCEQMYYLPFVMDLLTRLVAISSVTEEDAKNSGRPSS
jgi:hypothetical protein